MYSRVYSGIVYGIEGKIITVEADVSGGLPCFTLVGLLASEVKEAGERVKNAIRNSGYQLQAKRITVNLSPADIRKSGTVFDVAIEYQNGRANPKNTAINILKGFFSCSLVGVLPI